MKEITPDDSLVPIFRSEPKENFLLSEQNGLNSFLQLKEKEIQKLTAKQSATAKLKKLGLTDDEIAAFLT